jgi:hypothetical protein
MRLFAATGLLLAAAPSLFAQEGLNWYSDYRTAIQEAKRTGRPIFLEYRCEP